MQFLLYFKGRLIVIIHLKDKRLLCILTVFLMCDLEDQSKARSSCRWIITSGSTCYNSQGSDLLSFSVIHTRSKVHNPEWTQCGEIQAYTDDTHIRQRRMTHIYIRNKYVTLWTLFVEYMCEDFGYHCHFIIIDLN